MLRTTATKLTGWMVPILVLSAAYAHASPWSSSAAARLSRATFAQTSAPNADSLKRTQAADLLARARAAMRANDLETAEKLLAQAEATGVTYGPLTNEDTPRKLRRDLESQRSASAKLAKPSGMFAPAVASRVPTTDPFAGQRIGGSILPQQAQVTPLPKVEGSPVQPLPPEATAGNPFGRAQSTMPEYTSTGLPAAIARADSQLAGTASLESGPAANAVAGGSAGRDLLRAARRALAVGDVRRAGGFVQQARSLPVQFDPLDDTPDKAEAAIRKYQEVSSQASNSEAYRRSYARMLMEQSEALLKTGDLEEAEQLAAQAARQRLTYGPLESKPEDLLTRISTARRGGVPSASMTNAATAVSAAATLPAGGSANPIAAAAANNPAAAEALSLAGQARAALKAGQLAWAESLAQRAELQRLPDSIYPPENQPGRILLEIRQARQQAAAAGVMQASAVMPAGGAMLEDRSATRAVYDAGRDPTQNVAASFNEPGFDPRQTRLAQNAAPPASPFAERNAEPAAAESQGAALFRQGEEALHARQADRAKELFTQAAQHMNELDPLMQQRLQDRLQMLSPPSSRSAAAPASPTDEVTAKQQALARKVQADLAHQEANALAQAKTDPKAALKALQEARVKVETSGLDPVYRDQLLRRVDRTLADLQQQIDQNAPRIALDERNKATRDTIDHERNQKLENQQKLAQMVDEFNKLLDQERFAEAEVIAKKAAELDPENPVVVQLMHMAKFTRRYVENQDIAARKEQGFIDQLKNVDIASIPFDDNNPIQYGNAKQWQEMTDSRSKMLARMNRNRTERDLEIERRLRTPVQLQFENMPLSKVLEYLAKLSEINLHIDPKGLAEEGVSSDTPVTIDIRHEIMLKSALNLILNPLHLSYVVKDEVLKITSEQMRDVDVYPVHYPVGDLVMPIQNFVPSPRMGLAGAYHDAMANVGFGGGNSWGAQAPPLAVLATKNGEKGTGMINPAVLAQVNQATGGTSHPATAANGFGPGGLGGGTNADFDSLIDLIETTIAPTTWDTVGGPGSIAPFETNLSIVVSQTQAVHEQIADLLRQLRRLQDLQVTIEVRFITLNDNFFERIGVDFDFQIDDNIDSRGKLFGRTVEAANPITGREAIRDVTDRDDDNNKNMTVGLSAPGTFSTDLDIPFTQDSFSLAVPQFGGFVPSAGASLGFAILSDIEAFFFINAAQGDRRSNVLQAPKVTLFNGQTAFVSDTQQSPFVISVIPVVGDFAAAQQPVIVVLSEGTHLTVQAVVSNDKRYVRLTVVPFFSKIGTDVPTFQFTGSETTTSNTSADGWVNGGDSSNNRRLTNSSSSTTTKSGTSVQLPTFAFVTVTTTVSVPDGGTVLLGGIKRLSEGRNEFGVPILNKIPYLNRLFKNVGIGRETQSLMMMVTPRIIIQEEEEERLGIQTPQS